MALSLDNCRRRQHGSFVLLREMPTATSPAGGKLKVPHFDYKAKAVDWIKETIPDLYNKTLQIWPGWYPTNLAALPHGQNSWKL